MRSKHLNSHLNNTCLAHGVPEMDEWMHNLADVIGAMSVFHRFRNTRRDKEILWVNSIQDFEWIKAHHLRDLAKYCGITDVRTDGINKEI